MEPPSWREAQGSGARDGPAGRPRQATPAEPQVADSDAELEEEAGWGCPPSPARPLPAVLAPISQSWTMFLILWEAFLVPTAPNLPPLCSTPIT